MNDLERELEQMLHRVLDPLSARPVPARVVHGRSALKTVTGGAGAALTVKLLTGAVAAAAAVTVAGAVTTGSVNPVNWGTVVTQRVQTCKDNLANSGGHGIGPCVSELASTHGATVSGNAQHHGHANGHDNSGGNGNGNPGGSNSANGHADNGKSKSHSTPPSKSGSH